MSTELQHPIDIHDLMEMIPTYAHMLKYSSQDSYNMQ